MRRSDHAGGYQQGQAFRLECLKITLSFHLQSKEQG